jgi:two-component system, chemotaxis family, sensor kinase CheA
MDDLLADFLAETRAELAAIDAALARLGEDDTDREALNAALRALHTIKGTCGFLALPRIEALAHASEGALERVRDGRAAPDAIAVLAHAVGALQTILEGLEAGGLEPAGDDSAVLTALNAAPQAPGFNALDWAVELARQRDRLLALAGDKLNAHFAKLAAIAQEGAAALQAMPTPIEGAWKALPLLANELEASLGKPLDLVLEGGGTEIAHSALAPLKDALGHLIRNCADHGLESADERRAAGKPETGTIKLIAAREDENIVLTLADDGRGLDTARIRNRAISRGLIGASTAVRMSAEEIHGFIFAPGFSTAQTLTRYSGRGIGLDVVRENIEKLGGAIQLASEPGRGTIFTLTIPAARPPAPMAAPAAEEEELPAALPINDTRVA